ncbi:PE family protein [Nocardia donostiensis]|uniref:PE family protein n=1 Tax=Nocardia donostiensis TaxID=1538463 RepID=A0A1W0AV91_9NOCA|nr:PE family protein [Nocardia donostiensis]ONM49139.1 PE family protein [Nocardia donostiensis]OQS14156.1 PE family protein [Nocardia donostiensis]OQS15620.1 PE family protein [Nocardia donostiensis]
MIGHVDVTPELILAAAVELDLLADRLAGAAAISAPATHVIPSGADEASLLGAHHMNRGAATHDRAVAQGVLELHHAAATLRTQLAHYLAQDAASAAVTTLTGGPFTSIAV